MKVLRELAHDRLDGGAYIQHVVNSIGDAGLTRPARAPSQVHEIPHIFIQIDGNTFHRPADSPVEQHYIPISLDFVTPNFIDIVLA